MCNTYYDHWMSSWVFMAAYVKMFYHFGQLGLLNPPQQVEKIKFSKNK